MDLVMVALSQSQKACAKIEKPKMTVLGAALHGVRKRVRSQLSKYRQGHQTTKVYPSVG